MAKKPAAGKSSRKKPAAKKPRAKPAATSAKTDTPGTEAHKFSMPSGGTIRRLVKDKIATKQIIAKQHTGPLGARIKAAVDGEHVDRQILNFVEGLEKLEDVVLQVKLAHLYHYIEQMGLEKRATSQGDMFEEGRGARPVGSAQRAGAPDAGNGEDGEDGGDGEEETTTTSLAPAAPAAREKVKERLN